MKNLQKQEQDRLAETFLKLAQLVGEFRIKHYHTLSPRMRLRIRHYHKALIDYADSFYAADTRIIIANSKISLDRLAQSTASLKQHILKVQKTQKIINAIGAATRLGASIISKQPFSIIASLNDFIKKINTLKAKKIL